MEKLGSDWDITATKAFPKYENENLHIPTNDVKSMAIKLAATYFNNTDEGNLVFERCKLILAKKIGMYESWKMKQFFNDYWKPLINEASNNINTTIVEYCKTESEICKPSLIKAYKNLFLPFYIVKMPIIKLGMGQFVSYFSRLVTRNNHGYFLLSNKASPYEQIIERYLVKVYDNLSRKQENSFNISVYELVKILQLPQPVHSRISYANYVMKKFGCGGMEQEKLNIQWLDWIEKDETAVLDKDVERYPPCKNISAAERDGFGSCCHATARIKKHFEPILKIMKYAAQPPHFLESDEEMSLTFQNATFLGYNLQFPLKSSLKATKSRIYGDGTINYNPKIPFCQYSGNPKYPKKTDCALFSRSITNEGLGYNFNGANFWSLFQETPYTDAFSKIMNPYGGQGLRGGSVRDDMIGAYIDAGVRLPKSNGPSYGLNIALHAVNLYNDMAENTTFKKVKSSFKVM